MIKRVFVFSLITSGLRSVRTQMAAYLNLNEQFTTALRRLQGALLTAFQPIYDVAVPALLKGAAGAMVGIAGVLYSSRVKPIIGSVKNLFGIHSPSTVFAEIGGNLIVGLLLGISQKWTDIGGFFREKIEDIKKTLSEAWDSIKTTASEKQENIKTALREKWDKICDTAREKFSRVKDKVSEAW